MAERPGEKSERQRREEREARERIEQRVEQPWPGESRSPGAAGPGRGGAVHAGGTATGAGASRGGGVREEAGRTVEHGREQAEQAMERGREAARQKAESLFHSGSQHAARWIEQASEALRDGAESLEKKEDVRSAAPYVRRAAGGLDRFAETLRRDDLSDLLHRAEGVARRRPVAFLGGAAAAGLAIGRFLRSSGARRHALQGEGLHEQAGERGRAGSGVPEQPTMAGPHAPPIAVNPAETETRRSS